MTFMAGRGPSSSTRYRFSVVVERDKDGFFAFCSELQGCYSQGATYEEALRNIREAIRLHVDDRIAARESIPQPESVSLTTVEITA